MGERIFDRELFDGPVTVGATFPDPPSSPEESAK